MAGNSIFGNARVRFDPWSPDYGASLMSSGEDDGWSSRALEIDTSVEIPELDWRGIHCEPTSEDRSEPIAFVDGVRRMEANLVFEGPDTFLFGGFGCCAAGAMILNPGRMNPMDQALVKVSVQRFLFAPEEGGFSESVSIPQDYPPGSMLTHQVAGVSGTDPSESLQRLQQLMRQEEALVVDQVAPQDARLVVADGPLNVHLMREGVAGFIKSLHSFYVPQTLLPVLAGLRKHERSPLFRLYAEDTLERFSAYVRIQDPRPQDTALAGIARFETSGAGGFEKAQALLHRCAAAVPLFAAPYGRDPRAPQNLLPVSALEMELRRRLGNQEILRRIYQRAIML